MRRWGIIALGLALLALAGGGLAPSNAAAQEQRCFPETNQCLDGRFLQYWNQNGGLAVFGYPITPARSETNVDDGKSYLTQWFERNRFELHPENQAPYDVLLGRLGAAVIAYADPPEYKQRESGPKAGCLWFEQTGFNVCDNAGASFASYWQSHGLADPALSAYGRSLALFGLPVSRQVPAGPTGEVTAVQYFERARFEWHPGNPEPYKVLLGLLGSEVYELNTPATGNAPQAYNDTDTSVDLLASYYNAINRQDYQRAYGYLQNPQLAYADFVSGYANTASVQLIVRPPLFIDAGAGNVYQQVATMLVAKQRDGSEQRFAGCYITHKSNLHPPDIPQEDTWHINQANIAAVAADASVADLLAQACPEQQPPAYNITSGPVDLLASFYDAINRGDYARAYGYWETPPSAYADFVNGYANTASVLLLVAPPPQIQGAAGSSYASIPTALVATQRDGSKQLFSGCYVMRKSNVDTTNTSWHVYSATISAAAANAAISGLLAQGCSS